MNTTAKTVMQDRIAGLLAAGLAPEHLEVINESGNHNVPAGSESHFKVVVVAAAFAGLSAVKRHQAVYALVREPLATGVHALALHTYTPAEWAERTGAPASPPCLGGAKTGQ